MIARLGKPCIQAVNIIHQILRLKVDCIWKLFKTKKT